MCNLRVRSAYLVLAPVPRGISLSKNLTVAILQSVEIRIVTSSYQLARIFPPLGSQFVPSIHAIQVTGLVTCHFSGALSAVHKKPRTTTAALYTVCQLSYLLLAHAWDACMSAERCFEGPTERATFPFRQFSYVGHRKNKKRSLPLQYSNVRGRGVSSLYFSFHFTHTYLPPVQVNHQTFLF